MPLFLLIALDASTWIVGSPLPADGKAEHLREQREHSVRLIGVASPGDRPMQTVDGGEADIGDLAQRGIVRSRRSEQGPSSLSGRGPGILFGIVPRLPWETGGADRYHGLSKGRSKRGRSRWGLQRYPLPLMRDY